MSEPGRRWGRENPAKPLASSGTRNGDPSSESDFLALEQAGGSVVLKPPGGASAHPESRALHLDYCEKGGV